MNKSYYNLYSQFITVKEFLLNEICILRKELYTRKYGIEHLISFDVKFDAKIRKTELHVKFSLLQEEKLKFWNQIMENQITIGKMQNVLNTGKDSQAKSEKNRYGKITQ